LDILDLEARAEAYQVDPEGAAVLNELRQYMSRFISYPSDHCAIAHTLWVAHTHLMDVWDSTPRLAVLSPEPGSGKSRVLEVSELLVPRPVEAVNVTPAYLFRKVSDPEGRPTILYDEIDTVFGPKARDNEEIRGLLNAGHRKHSVAGRCVVRGKEVFTEEIPAYCAVAMAGLGALPDTILTRSVVIRMKRRAPGETVEPYRRRIVMEEAESLRDRLASWLSGVHSKLEGYFPDLPQSIVDRDADVWESLIAIADVAGGKWSNDARVSAVSLVSDSKRGSPSLGIKLLEDLRYVFGIHETIFTHDILKALSNISESPWGDYKGKQLTALQLANLLKPYGVASKQVRVGPSTNKGYRKEDLHDAWDRYLGDPHLKGETYETLETDGGGVSCVSLVSPFADN
jgi:Protein of unknown function (DUF3631)